MSETSASLRRKIHHAEDLRAVARTMKAIAASRIGQFQTAVRALEDYHRTIELGLSACMRGREPATSIDDVGATRAIVGTGAIVFGSDQGLIGRFNEIIGDYAIATLAALPGTAQVVTVGERIHAHMVSAALRPLASFALPNSVRAIAPLVAQIQIAAEARGVLRPEASLYIFHNRPQTGSSYEPVHHKVLPLDSAWQQRFSAIRWPAKQLPELLDTPAATLRALIREYLFISIFRASAESLASENASRLAAMERAETNIAELLTNLSGEFNQLRQSMIDEELFDVISGYEALSDESRRG